MVCKALYNLVSSSSSSSSLESLSFSLDPVMIKNFQTFALISRLPYMKSLLLFPFPKDIVIHPSNSILLLVITRVIMMIAIYYALYVPGTIYIIFFVCTADP